MLTKSIFLGIIIIVILQRLFELKISQRNAAYILSKGGEEKGDNLLIFVKIMQVSWWIAMIVEVWGLKRPCFPIVAVIALTGLLGGQLLRYLSMQALGWRWTLSIMTVPDLPIVDTGIYQYLRHPNWLGVILEIAALPLIHGAFMTAIAFSIINAILINQRVKTEEKALIQDTNYAMVMIEKPRFLPRLFPNKIFKINS